MSDDIFERRVHIRGGRGMVGRARCRGVSDRRLVRLSGDRLHAAPVVGIALGPRLQLGFHAEPLDLVRRGIQAVHLADGIFAFWLTLWARELRKAGS